MSDEECDVSAGQSIQRAIDHAEPYDHIVVCEATYEESLTIDKDGIQLLGKGTPVLDGTVLGATHGIILANGVKDVKIAHFEIQNYDADLEDDGSSGIASEGNTFNVTIQDNEIHDNAWAGVLAANEGDIRWRIDDNRFDKHGFAHVFLQGLLGALIQENYLASSDQGLILADTRIAHIANNTIHGGGNGAIALTPGLGATSGSDEIEIVDNAIEGKWTHGLWLLDPTNTTLEHNEAALDATALTLGGDPTTVDVNVTNNFSASKTDLTYAQALDTFETGQPNPPDSDTSLSTVSCDFGFTCAPAVVEDLFDHALQTVLNPQADREDREDIDKLAACEGQDSTCLRSQFFNDTQRDSENGWTVDVPDSRSPYSGTLHFLEAGVRRPGDDFGNVTYTDDLEGEWTTLVLCRLSTANAVHPCQAAPLRFDFGLNVNHAEAETPRHHSGWRLFEPGSGVHDRLERLHGPDATLFKRTTEAHTADSSPPEPTPLQTSEPAPSDSSGEEMAGRLKLTCSIIPAEATDQPTSGCHEPTLATEDLQPAILHCPAERGEHVERAHDYLGTEAIPLWQWSNHCEETDSPIVTDWSSFLTGAELRDYAQAHEDYYNATTLQGREENLTKARDVLERQLSEDIALRLEGHGMPQNPNKTLLENVSITTLEEGLEDVVLYGEPAVAHDDKVYFFNFRYLRPFLDPPLYHVLEFDPSGPGYNTVSTSLPGRLAPDTAVSTGETIYLFEGREIYEFDPAEGDIQALHTTLPYDAEGAVAVWDEDSRVLSCPDGCAYILGAHSQILAFNPTLGIVQPLNTPSPDQVQDVEMWGIGGWVLSAHPGEVSYFDPSWGRLYDATSVDAAKGAEMAFGGGSVYIFGGTNSSGPTDKIREFDTRRYPEITLLNHTLPTPMGDPIEAQLPDRTTYLTEGADVHEFHPSLVSWSTGDHAIVDKSDGFNAVGLSEAGTSNVDVKRVQVADQGEWTSLRNDSLAAFVPARIEADISYDATNGSRISDQVELVIEDQGARLTGKTATTYGNSTYVGVEAANPSNRNYSLGYDPVRGAEKRVQSIPKVNVSSQGASDSDVGLFTGALELPKAVNELTACIQELHTAAPDGTRTNLDPASTDGSDRLAIENNRTCQTLGLNATALRMHAPYSMTLEYREGEDYGAELNVLDDPSDHITDADDHERNRTLETARASLDATPLEAAVQPVGARLVVTVPHDLSTLDQALVLGNLIADHAGVFGTFAVEIDDLPLPDRLDRQIHDAVTNDDAVIVTGAGSLPAQAHDLDPEDKLGTIHGLASHPEVLTVGAGSVEAGLSPWSRRGPAAETMGPKPDLVAPSPANTTRGAVQHVLPFVEALTLRGLHEVNLVRTVLAGYALPVATEANTSATYWGQGVGAVDLSAFLQLNATGNLIDAYAERQDLSTTDAKQQLALALNTTTTEIENAEPTQLVGAAADPAALVRSAVSGTLVNLTLNAPALPATSVADYGVVNHNRSKPAYVGAIDLDSLVNATLTTTRDQLREAGYTGTELDERMDHLTQLFSGVVDEGQRVTTNVTHYHYPDFMVDDYLYTAYEENLNATLEDAETPEGASQVARENLRDRIDDWRLDPHHFVPEQTGTVNLTIETDEECGLRPVRGALDIGNAVIDLLLSEVRSLAPTMHGTQAAQIGQQLPRSSSAFLSQNNQEFVQEQGRQLACQEDVERLLGFLQNRTHEMQQLKSTPMGAWNQTEALTGAWNHTPLGQQIANTTDPLNQDAARLADNTTLVLDVTLDALDRALELVRQKQDLDAPRIEAQRPTSDPDELAYPPTDPNRTSQAQLGPYVGLAQITSHGVNVTNPFTGDEVLERNLTVPLPSFLWNNPTLEWNEAYRDTSPLPNRSVQLDRQPGSGVDAEAQRLSVTHNESLPTVDNGTGVDVSLAVNATHHFAQQRDSVQHELEQVTKILDNATQIEATEPFHEVIQAELNQTHAELEDLVDERDCAAQGSACPNASAIREEITEARAKAPLTTAFSHKASHQRVTDGNGDASFPHLFPGRYEVTVPYAYSLIADQNRTVPYNQPGLDWFDGPINDTDMWVGRQADDRTRNLPLHPSAHTEDDDEPRPDLPQAVRENTTNPAYAPYVEVHKQTLPAFHEYTLAYNGVDLPGVACENLRRVASLTDTPLASPGCETPLLAGDAAELGGLAAFANCVLGNQHRALSDVEAERCRIVKQALEDRSCEPNVECLDAETRAFRDALRAIVAIEDRLTGSNAEVAVPFARSPTRALQEHREELGFTLDNLLNRTKQLNPGEEQATLESAINDTLEAPNLLHVANRTTDPETPEKKSSFDHTLAQGLGHRVTDRVSGLDWAPYPAERAPSLPRLYKSDIEESWDSIETALDRARLNLDTDPEDDHESDEELLLEYKRQLEEDKKQNRIDAWNEGLRLSAENRTAYLEAGFDGNGTVSRGAYRLTDTEATGPVRQEGLTDDETCQSKAIETGVPEPFFVACEGVNHKLGPGVESTSSVDTAALANVLLEETRRHEEALTSGNDPLRAGTVRNILTKSVALTAGDPNHTIRRTDDGIAVNTSETDPVPMIGALYYNTPLPPNEQLRYRLDGELHLDDTAALVVTTANPAVKQGVLEAVDGLNTTLQNADPDTATEQTIQALTAVDDRLQDLTTQVSRQEFLIRADLLGFPLKLEQASNLPVLANAAQADDQSSLSSCGTPTPSAPDADSEVCSKGLMAAQPDGYYNYSRTYEMGTKDMGPNRMGPEALHTVVVYLPSVTQDEDPVDQKLVLRNFTQQLDLFTGLNTTNTRETTDYSATARIGYRANVEEFQQYWALPDQPLTTTEGEGVVANFTADNKTITLSPAGGYLLQDADGNTTRVNGTMRLLDGLGLPLQDDTFQAYCPDTNAPGYATQNQSYWPRGSPGMKTFQHYGGDQQCSSNTIHALQPQHVAAGEGPAYVSNPKKQVRDSLAYQFNVPGGESELFTGRWPAGGGLDTVNGLNNPLAMLGQRVRGPVPAGPQTDAETAHWTHDIQQVRDATLDNPAFDLRNATPFLASSWLASPDETEANLAVSLHNYATLNASMAEQLMDDPWDPSTSLKRADVSNPAVEDEVHEPNRVATSSHRLPERNNTQHHAAVAAHGFHSHLAQGPGDRLRVTEEAAALAGHGISGSGLAVDVTASWTVHAETTDRESLLENHTITTQPSLHVDLYNLGGNDTTNSDCRQVPLWEDYAQPFFRCTGWDRSSAGLSVEVQGSNDGCYSATLGFLEAGHRLALDAQANATQRPYFQPLDPAQRVLGELAHDPVDADPRTAASGPFTDATIAFTERSTDLTGDAMDVVECLQADGDADIGVEPGNVTDLVDLVRSIAEEGLDGLGVDEILNLTAPISPKLAKYGEPNYGVEPKILVSERTRETNGLNETGTFPVNITINEWDRELQNGTLRSTETTPDGTTTEEIRARYDETDVDTTFSDNTTLDLAHGERWSLNLSVQDDRGENQSDEVRFIVDDVQPTIESNIDRMLSHGADDAWMNDRSKFDVTWTLKDNLSGLHSLDVQTYVMEDLSKPLYPPWEPVAVDVSEEDVGSTSPTNVTATIEADASTNDAIVIEATVEDLAGNKEVLKETVVIDQTPPALSGEITNDDDLLDLIEEPHLNGTWSVEDRGDAGITEASVWLHNRSSKSPITLEELALDRQDKVSGTFEERPWPNTTYELKLKARDALNNTNEQQVDIADVQITPLIDLGLLTWVDQKFNDVEPHRFVNVTLPDYHLGVEELSVNITHEDNASNREHLGVSRDVNGTLVDFWNASGADENEEYNVSVDARHGQAHAEASVTVFRPEANMADDRPLAGENDANKGVMYGRLDGDGDSDTFYAYYQDCDDSSTEQSWEDWARFQLTGHANDSSQPDVKLAVQKTYPPSDYEFWYTSSDSGNREVVNASTSDDDEVLFSIVAESQTDADVAYEVLFSTDCREPQPASTNFETYVSDTQTME